MAEYFLDLRTADVGGAVGSGQLYCVEGGQERPCDERLPELTARTVGSEVVLLLHGYNVPRADARESLLRYAGLLARGGLTMLKLPVLWPGDGWAKALTYPFEGNDADDSADALVQWLARHVHCDASVSFVAHSLGCRVAMNTALKLATTRDKRVPRLGRICLMAPAIDNDCLGRIGRVCFRDATLASQRLAVLASEEDLVLRFAYPLGDLAQSLLFGERFGRALGRTGPRETDADVMARLHAVPLADPQHGVDHGHYLASRDGVTTRAQSEAFVARFIAGAEAPHWPMQRP